MNSAEDIVKYNDNGSHYCSPILARRNINNSNFTEKSPKKDKKWTFGSLFRRKKKESDSSSEDGNQTRNFLQKKVKKGDKRKRVNITLGFDHVVVPRSSRQTNKGKNNDDSLGILSEPIMTKNNYVLASDYTSKSVSLKDSKENFNRNELNKSNLGSPTVCSLDRKRKMSVKVRAEARRDTSKGEDTSDDDSQISAFKSDESLFKHKDASLSRRSRAARTQRYLRRLSKDEETRESSRWILLDHTKGQPIREENHVAKKIHKSFVVSTSKPKLCFQNSISLKPNISGLTTIPPTHSIFNKYKTVTATNELPNRHVSYSDIGKECNITNGGNYRSGSCESNINNSTSPEVNGFLHVEFLPHQSFSKHSNLPKKYPSPSLPPRRDSRRVISTQNSDSRPISYSFENEYKTKSSLDCNMNRNDSNNIFFNQKCRATSEDHLPSETFQRVTLLERPSSTTPQMSQLQKLNRGHIENDGKSNKYRYLMDKNPRSRKPICIQAEQPTWSQKTFNFWRQKDKEVLRCHNRKSTSPSSLTFTAQTQITTNIFLPKLENRSPIVSYMTDNTRRHSSPFRPIYSPKPSSEEEGENKHKSSNLEDALDELEAIYNSLHLGDEDLLDRAEKREEAAVQKKNVAVIESISDTASRELINDSKVDLNIARRRKLSKRSEPNIQTDDMAFRKLNRERYNTVNVPHSAITSMSYLLTSPVFNTTLEELVSPKIKSDEPDVTFDDVVFRNVTYTNNTLKVPDPQLPFGIPVGPISPAASSDYLHATPEESQKICGPKNTPDLVKDDLAYRNLRKDANKGSTFPMAHADEEFLNTKQIETLKKKRAVRSFSANIGNLIQTNDIHLSSTKDSQLYTQNITDVADALEIARQILRDKENKINATRQAFMSDGELKYRRFESTSTTEQRTRFMNKMNLLNRNNPKNDYDQKLQVTIPDNDYKRLDCKSSTHDCRCSRMYKESLSTSSSPSDDDEIKKQLQQSTLDELLTSLAVETRETSDKITEELNLIDELHIKTTNKDFKLYSAGETYGNGKYSKHRLCLEESTAIQDYSNEDHLQLCQNLLQCVVSSEVLSANTEELDLNEEVRKIKIEPVQEIVANIVLLPPDGTKPDMNLVSTVVYSESDHDYVNILSDYETNKTSEADEPSFIITNNEKDADLLAAFEAVDETLRNIKGVGSKKDEYQTVAQTDRSGGEKCFSVEYIALPIKGCAYMQRSQLSFNIINHCNEPKQNFISELYYNNNISEYEYEFHIGGEVKNLDINRESRCLREESLESLKSPKLVKQFDENYTFSEGHEIGDLDRDVDTSDEELSKPTMKLALPSNEFVNSDLKKKHNYRHTLDEVQPSYAWYENPGIIAVACSFGIASKKLVRTEHYAFVLLTLFRSASPNEDGWWGHLWDNLISNMSSTLCGKHLHAQEREMVFNVYQWIKSQNEDQYIKEIKEKVLRATGVSGRTIKRIVKERSTSPEAETDKRFKSPGKKNEIACVSSPHLKIMS
ncbi:hypothetical protein FQA39_LY13337 [Lamprigera yunnana]|nr:hypothetical protein FQA39_LY13337 [Lamprigera yunnana]